MPDNNDLNIDKIRERVDSRYNQMIEFVTHLVVYILTNAGLFVLAGILGSGLLAQLTVAVMLLWGAGLAAHAITALSGIFLAGMRQRALAREIEMELYYRDGEIPSFVKQKRKGRPQPLRISDDGELIPDEDDEAYSAAHYTQRN